MADNFRAKLVSKILSYFQPNMSLLSEVDHIHELYEEAYYDLADRNVLPETAPPPDLLAESFKHIRSLIETDDKATPSYLLRYLRDYRKLIELDKETGELKLPENFQQTKIPLLIVHMVNELLKDNKEFYGYVYGKPGMDEAERDNLKTYNKFNKLLKDIDNYRQILIDLTRPPQRGGI